MENGSNNFFLIHYKGICEDVTVLRFTNKGSALAHGQKVGSDRTMHVINKPDDFGFATNEVVLRIYNALADKPVKKFDNKEAGHERTVQLLNDKFGSLASPDDQPEEQETAQDSPAEPGKSTKRKTKESTMATKKAAKKAVKKAAKKTNGAGRKPRIDTSKKLKKLVDKNPRREGTHGYKSFSLISNGMTVEKYLEKGGRMNDLNWDIKHKYVELS